MTKVFKKKYTNIGILGGSFDPPHKGHFHISKIALRKIKLDKLIWAVTKKNPHKKKPFFTTKTRIKLSKKLTKSEKRISVKYFDDKVKSEKTLSLLKYIHKKNKNKKIYFLMGADNFVKLHKWDDWKKIPKIAKIVVFARQNYYIKVFNSIAAKKLKKNEWLYINSKKINISSSLIRKFW